MLNSPRLYAATFTNTAIGTATQSIMELQVPDNTFIEIIRAWISPQIGATLANEVVAIALYGNDAAATGGTAMTEQPVTPAAAADPSNTVALLEPTIGATPLDLISDAFHLQNGWLYLPVPEERPMIVGSNADPGDNIGIRTTVTTTATPSVSGGIIWIEVSAA
jgi:hypothetical protein